MDPKSLGHRDALCRLWAGAAFTALSLVGWLCGLLHLVVELCAFIALVFSATEHFKNI